MIIILEHYLCSHELLLTEIYKCLNEKDALHACANFHGNQSLLITQLAHCPSVIYFSINRDNKPWTM